MNKRALAVTLAVVVLLTGCANPTALEAGPTQSTVEASQVDGVGVTAGTVAAWSALFVEQRKLVDSAQHSCEQGRRVVVATKVGTLMRQSVDTTSPSYLGVLPEERQLLVDDAIAAADDVIATSEDSGSTAGASEGNFSLPQCDGQGVKQIPGPEFEAFEMLKTSMGAWVSYE
ncbi:MAG: hypothetical protein ABIM89_13205 [Mycobacteriales bacterium]